MVAKLRKVSEPKLLLRLDLGCGQRPKEGFQGVDISPDAKPAFVVDLSKPGWPWKPGTVGEVYSSHFIEHLSGSQRMVFFNELYRVMAPGAQATLIFPYYSSVRAIQDPTHAWPPLADASFLYYNKSWRKANGLDHYPITADFDFVPSYSVAMPWAQKHEEVRAMAMNSYLNVIPDGQVVMTRRPDE